MKQRIYRKYHENGNIKLEIHYLGNKKADADNIANFYYHRIDGPAYIQYSKNRRIVCEMWWIENKQIKEEDIIKLKIAIELRKEVLK
jgi:hypothetical protein